MGGDGKSLFAAAAGAAVIASAVTYALTTRSLLEVTDSSPGSGGLDLRARMSPNALPDNVPKEIGTKWGWAYWGSHSLQERHCLRKDEAASKPKRFGKQDGENCSCMRAPFPEQNWPVSRNQKSADSQHKMLSSSCDNKTLHQAQLLKATSARANLPTPCREAYYRRTVSSIIPTAALSRAASEQPLSSSLHVRKSTRMSVEGAAGGLQQKEAENVDGEHDVTAEVLVHSLDKWQQTHSVVWPSAESLPESPRDAELLQQSRKLSSTTKSPENDSKDWKLGWDDKPCLISRNSDRVSFEDRAVDSKMLAREDGEEKKGGRADFSATVHSLVSPAGLHGEEAFAWVRSQMIGIHADIVTPFGPRQMTYADYIASGRCLQYVEDLLQARVLPYYGNTHTEDSVCGQRTTHFAHESGEFIKKCVRAGPEHKILFCGSGCTGAVKRLQEVMGVAVPSTLRSRVLETLKPSERWVVFVGPYEHHSNLLTWRQSLADVIEVPLTADGVLDMSYLEAELQSERWTGRPKLGSFSAASNVTGILTDTRALAKLLHAHGAYACLDFAAAAPYVDMDMRAGKDDGYDALFVSPHKFVGGPGSAGVLVLDRKLYTLAHAPPSTSGGGTVAYVNGINEEETLYIDDIEQREDAGTPAILQKMRAALAFWVKSCIGADAIQSAEKALIHTALQRLARNPRVEVLGNCEVPRLAILSFLIRPFASSANPRERKALNGRFVVNLLNDLFGIQARGGCSCAGPYGHALMKVDRQLSVGIREAIAAGYESVKPGWTRLGFAYFITQDEFEFILAAIEFVAEHGIRFLPLYDFDWKSGNWEYKRFRPEEKSLFEAVTADEAAGLGRSRAGTVGPGVNGGPAQPPYERYLQKARAIAKTLPAYPGTGRPVDANISEQVLTFVA